MGRFAVRARNKGFKSYALGVASPVIAAAATAQGFDYLSGDALAQSTGTAQGLTPLAQM